MNSPYSTTPSTSTDATIASTGSSDLGDTLSSTSQNTYSEKSSGKNFGASLRSELSNLKSDLDSLLSRATNLSDTELSQEHARLMTKFSSMKSAARGMAAEANRQFNRGVDVTTDYVKDKPLQSVAVATGVGLLLGMLFKSR